MPKLPHCCSRVGLLMSLWSLSLFLSCFLRNNICCCRWFINFSGILLIEFPWIYSLGLVLTHDCKNSFLKLLTSVKVKLFIFLNFSKICNVRFSISSIKQVFLGFHHFLSIFGLLLAVTSIPNFLQCFVRQTDFELTISKAFQKFLLWRHQQNLSIT